MSNEIDELRARVEQLTRELGTAHERIAVMEGPAEPARLSRKKIAAIVLVLLALTALAVLAQGSAGSLFGDPDLRALQDRVMQLERGEFRAPFVVLDRNGKVLLRVADDPNVVQVFGSSGTPAIVLQADNAGGELLIRNARSETAALGPGSNGNMVLRFSNQQGQNIAGMGISANNGHGTLMLGDATGHQALIARVDENRAGRLDIFDGGGSSALAALKVDDGRGTVAVYNRAGMAIATMTESGKVPGVGRLTAHDADGNGVFSAGWTPGRLGAACIASSRGSQCLGIGVPLGAGLLP